MQGQGLWLKSPLFTQSRDSEHQGERVACTQCCVGSWTVSLEGVLEADRWLIGCDKGGREGGV